MMAGNPRKTRLAELPKEACQGNPERGNQQSMEKREMKYRTVIDKIGGGNVSEAARQLRLPFKTVNDWKNRGIVPHWREDHIRAVAQRLGVNVDVEENVNV